jgi:hypothetical protein
MSQPKLYLRQFVLDVGGKLHRVTRTWFDGFMEGRRTARELRFAVPEEAIFLVTAVVDGGGEPRQFWLERYRLEDGAMAPCERERLDARLADHLEEIFGDPRPQDVLRIEDQLHLRGWPADLSQQLAELLDTTPARITGLLPKGWRPGRRS